MADKIASWFQDKLWEILLKFTLCATPALMLTVLGFFIWTVKQLNSHDKAISLIEQKISLHDSEAATWKDRIKELERAFVQYQVNQETFRSDLRAIDQSIKTVGAQMELQVRQAASQGEKMAELREKIANALQMFDAALSGKYSNENPKNSN